MKKQVKEQPTTWLDKGGCGSCKSCGMDMDMDPYCAHPKVIKTHKWGLDINQAWKRCKGNWWKKR